MATSRKKLPIGIQTFSKLRNENCYYADKSGIAVDLAERGQYYFLSRPRRFGKSLFIDTLKELFEGNQLLFEGLQAENRWDWRKKHPIIYISIPYNWYVNNPMAQYEGYYASIFYSHFAGLGVDVMVEDATNHGRIDMTVLFNQRVYIFEFKVEEFTPSGKALQQIKDRNYADKYKARNEPIYLIGVEFSKNNRNIIGFDVENDQKSIY